MAIARHFHIIAGRKIRSFILQADVVVPTPRWGHRLGIEHKERLGRGELELFVDPKLNRRMGDAAISAGPVC